MSIRPPSVGDIIRLTKDIDWDGEDSHPPGIIAKKGDIMQVRKARGFDVIAAHTPLTKAMFIEQSEYETVRLASDTIPPEWPGDCRDPQAGCWHVKYINHNSTLADPVYCRKPCSIGSRYCIEHLAEQYESDE